MVGSDQQACARHAPDAAHLVERCVERRQAVVADAGGPAAGNRRRHAGG